MNKYFLFFLSALCGISNTEIQSNGSVSAAEPQLPETVWEGKTSAPPNGLPDGEIALYGQNGKVSAAAWFGSPTTRYRHGILGDAIEAGSLHIAFRDGRNYALHLPQSEVFEDRTPRLIDLDGDGRLEIIAIRSYQSAGGSVALYGIRNETLVELATTDPIGRSNRWLNIAGISDYAGRGTPQIAYVETPHIGGTLRIVEWRGSKLVQITSMRGFSNHEIGSRNQNLSADIHYNEDGLPDLAVPSNDRRTLKIVGFSNGKIAELGRVQLPNAVDAYNGLSAGSQKPCARFKLKSGDNFDLCAP